MRASGLSSSWSKPICSRMVRYLGATLLAAAGVALSALFKLGFGAPNYSLGVVISTALACYFYGLGPALLCFAAVATGVLYWLIAPVGVLVIPKGEHARMLAIVLTSGATCTLVLLLRSVEAKLRAQGALLEDRTRDLERMALKLEESRRQLADALDHESHIASTLQSAFLPAVPHRVGNFALAAIYEAGAAEAKIGGDFYDIFRAADGRLCIAIGDVSGKGLMAAKQAIAAKYGVRYCASNHSSPAKCLARLNELLCADPDFSGFVTLFLGTVDPLTNKLTYCSGGHEPPLILRGDTKVVDKLEVNSTFLAMLEDGEFEDGELDLRPGDHLLLFTDGLTEARGESGLLGSDGLARVMADNLELREPAQALRGILQTVKAYAGGSLRDDAAAVLIRVD